MRLSVSASARRLMFDAIMRADHTSTLTITTHPVEKGGDITDHARIDPDGLVLELMSTDVGNGAGHSDRSFRSLKTLQRSREPLNVVTRLFAYKNLLIASLSASEDYTTMSTVRAIVTFQEVKIVSTATVGVQGRSNDQQKTGSSTGGTQQASPVGDSGSTGNQSILSGIASSAASLFGK